MYKINLVNKDWEFIDVIKVHETPRVGDFIYNTEDGFYYSVEMITHNLVKRRWWFQKDKLVISVIIKQTNRSNPKE